MIRSHLLLSGVLALALVAPAAHAVTGTISIGHAIDGDTNTLNFPAGDGVELNINYTVTDLGGDSAHVEVDLCTPATGYIPESQSNTVNLTSCTNGDGRIGSQAQTPSIVAPTGSQGTTGVFSILVLTAEGLIQNGTQWTIPARLVLDSTGAVIANATIVLTIVATSNPAFLKQFYAVTAANQPGTSNVPGYDVSWLVSPQNDLSAGIGFVYFAGTTTIADPVPSGAVYVDGELGPAGSGTFSVVGPAFAAANLNSGTTITSPGTAPSTVSNVILTINNLATDNTFIEPSFIVTYWYPQSTTTATNTATATFPDGTQKQSTASIYLGQALGAISKEHICPGLFPSASTPQYSTLTAFYPDANVTENPQCAWGPSAPVQYKLDISATEPVGAPIPGAAMPMLNPMVTDVIPSNMVLASLDGIYAVGDTFYQFDLSSQWQISGSADLSCSATAGSYSAISLPATQASLASIRCVRYSFAGFASAVNIHYSAVLDQTDQSTLDATNGAYELVTNNAYFNADNFASDYSVSLKSTFWNSRQPSLDFLDGSSTQDVGTPFTIFTAVPFSGSGLINNYLGFTNLTFGGTLPPELDMTAAPYPYPGAALPVDDSGAPVTPVCTFTAQNRSVDPVALASWQCTIPGHIPSFTTDPFSYPGCAGPDFCTANNGGVPWNNFYFYLPEVVVSGSQGQDVQVTAAVWSDEGTIVAPDLAPAGSSSANPVYASYFVFIEGTSQLTVRKSTPSISVQTGHTINYFIDYSNTGTATTTNTYVYDLFGMNPTTGDSLSQDYASDGCTATSAPTLAAVSHISGSPASVLQYTTVANPTLDNTVGTWTTWTTTPPSDFSLVTGVRFQLNSEFTGNPGDYSPNDQAGEEEITLQAPAEIGAKLCNMAAIDADGFTIAGALAVGGAVPITPICNEPDGCDPVSVPGPNATVAVGSSCGAVPVPLDGSGSTNAVSYRWSENGNVFSTIAKPTASLALGTHTLTLTVTNSFGVSASNSLVITVADQTPPQLSCPASVVATVNSLCVPSYTITPTANDICDPSVTGQQPTINCTTPALTAGQNGTTATCTATDSAGLSSATCSVPVTVDTSGCAPQVSTNGTITADVDQSCGPASVQVSAASSANAVSYSWSEGSTILSTEQSPTLSLGLGVHHLTVTAANALGQIAQASEEVDVVNPYSPTITCQTLTLTADSTCTASYSLSPTVSDSCDPSVSGEQIQVSCGAFGPLGLGQSTIPCTATNSGGQTATCNSTINVVAGSSSGGMLTLSPLSGSPGSSGAFCNNAPLTAPFSLTGGRAGLTEYPAAPTFIASYLDNSNNPQSLTVTAAYNDESGSAADGTLTISGLAGIDQNAQITITALDPNNGNAVIASTTTTAIIQPCDCADSFLASSGGTTGTLAADNSSFCGTSQLSVPFILTPACGQVFDEDYVQFNVSYAGPNGTESIYSYGFFNTVDPNTSLPNTPDGILYFQAPADVSGPTTFTIQALADDGVTVIGTTSLTETISQTCDSAICVPDGLVMFEDNWPANGDLDFNDQTIAYNFQFLQESDGVTVDQMLATFNVLSVGATIHNGLYLHLPIPSTANVTITLYNSLNANTVTVTPIGVGTEPDMIIPIVDDTRSLFPGADASFINTDPSFPAYQATALSLLVTFNDSTSNQMPVALAPYDLFIAQSGDFGHQIHLAQYPGTKLATRGLFDTVDDNTNLLDGPYYVNQNGLPFALNIPVYQPWALEKVPVGDLYPSLASFFETGGQPTDWYDYPNYQNAFEVAAPLPGSLDQPTYAPSPNLFMQPLSGAAGSCESGDFGAGPSTGEGGGG